MADFFKRLFCDHDYKAVNNVFSKIYTKETNKVIMRCEKCGKIREIKMEWVSQMVYDIINSKFR